MGVHHSDADPPAENAGTASNPGAGASHPEKDPRAKVAEVGQKALRSGADQARVILDDLKAMRFKDEVLPIDQSNLSGLVREFVFWAATLLGVVPLLIVSVSDAESQLTLFALFFALVWGVIFKRFVLEDDSSWGLPIAALFFTGIVGLFLLLFVYRYFLPDFYLNMASSESRLVSLFGFVFQVGIWEELVKALPVLLYLRWKRAQADPLSMVGIGVFSGLGFAAFENLHYGERAILASFDLTMTYGASGLASGVQRAMITTMLRSLSLVFCHAVWAGIVAYFIAIAGIERRRWGALILVGIGVAAVLHGTYDWLTGVQMTMAAATAGFSFVLFYGYMYKLREKLQGRYRTA